MTPCAFVTSTLLLTLGDTSLKRVTRGNVAGCEPFSSASSSSLHLTPGSFLIATSSFLRLRSTNNGLSPSSKSGLISSECLWLFSSMGEIRLSKR